MSNKIQETQAKFATVAFILNGWFGVTLKGRIDDIGYLLRDKEIADKLEKYFLGPKKMLMYKEYYNALYSFWQRWYQNERVNKYKDAWAYCWEFFIDPASALHEVLKFAPKEEKDWLWARIRMPAHRIKSLEEFELQFKEKLTEGGLSEFDINLMYEDGEPL